MSLVSLKDISIRFGEPPLLDSVNYQIQPEERICLLGRNGSGKSTLLKIIHGQIPADSGEIAYQPHIKITHLPQEVPYHITGTVWEVVNSGFLKHDPEMIPEESWQRENAIKQTVESMNLNPSLSFETLSAGLKRQVLLARALVCSPDVLLLDEPTNHLDIDAITRQEAYLARLKSTILFVTHDRMFLRRMATQIVEIERGQLTTWNCNYETYLQRKEAMLESEIRQRIAFQKKLASEEEWLRRGVKARRTRNEGRVKAIMQMREKRNAWRDRMGSVDMELQEARKTGRLVIESQDTCFSYEDQPVINHFSTMIMRGDRVGIIGPNGCGKTTLLKLLLGKLTPQYGTIRHGTHLEVLYFDQLRQQLDEEKTVMETVGGGQDRLTINGNTRYITAYLSDFLFSPERVMCPVKILSGGERNRLLLAKLFTKPCNVMVLDEPTNDLDAETLDILEDILLQFQGTLLMVSHDREFLNNVVTCTLAYEGNGFFQEYAGGYDDWLLQKPAPEDKEVKRIEKKGKPKSLRPRKITFKEKRELNNLPALISNLEKEQQELYTSMSNPDFFKQNGQTISSAQDRLEVIKEELEELVVRWVELEELNSVEI